MRFLATVLALLVLGVANAHHNPSHRLKYPEFEPKKTHVYDLTINATSGVPGLHPQVSKSVIHMQVEIYAKTETDLLIRGNRVMVSHSLPGVSSESAQVVLKKNVELENHMKVPIRAFYKNGMIKSYTLDPKETIESAKIKRTILRNLEIYFDQVVLTSGTESWSPITYNRTQSTPVGNYTSHYVITSSPYASFPYDKNVYNISRSDNYEVLPYLAYRSHHNYERQGCPEVCKKNHIENPYSAGCPVGQEPYNTPIKKSYFQKHNLRTLSTGYTIMDLVETKETHIADLYDQNLKVFLMSILKFKRTTTKTLPETTGQKEYTDLNDMSIEINEKEISERCGYPDPREAVHAAKSILEEIATIVIAGNIEEPKSKLIGEHVVLLQKALTVMKQGDFRTLQESIVSYDDLPSATEAQRVKRQIWIDMLPIIGTSESVSYIVHLIRENVNKPNKAISVWESKTILEALPMNILEPTERTISELSRLLEVISDSKVPGYNMFYSASHLAVARVIKNLCTVSRVVEEEGMESSPERNRFQREFLLRSRQNAEEMAQRRCPKTVVKKFVSDVAEKMKTTTEKTKRVIYIQTLARCGVAEALRVLKPYAHGHIEGLSHSYIDFVRTVTVHSLYHLASIYPRPVQDIVVPIFFNKTESPKLRNAAFGIMIKSHPSLGLFQHVAEETWNEPSEEVASFVTSTLETFGNSTIPCHQLTARRIKKILPQIKRNVRGVQRAKNNLWSFFDSIRGFGMEGRLEFTPSNESFIPSVIYAAMGANVDSFKDLIYQYAVNSQGLTSRNVWDAIIRTLGLPVAEDIPKEMESNIFQDIEMLNRDPEFWRFTIYRKVFYSSSYYYYDSEESAREDVFKVLKEQLSHYMKWDSHGNMEGHIVRLYIPSSYHTKAIAHTMPTPVEFEMRNPLILSLKLKMEMSATPSKGMKYALDLKPSVYYTTLYTNQILNLGDCKDTGVYYEKRFAATYPVKIAFDMQKEERIRMSYTFPELPKTVFTFNSEAGTYAGKKKLVALPPMEDRRTYKTIPTLFKKTYNFGAVGLPPFVSEVHTEDIQLGYEEVPRNDKEIAHEIIKEFFNAGWRRKSIVVRRVPDSTLWTPKTEVRMYINCGRDHVIPKERSTVDWTKGLKFEDDLHEKDVTAYSKEGKIIYEKLTEASYIHDKFSIRVEQTLGGKPAITGSLNVSYKHTYEGVVYLFHINASANVPHIKRDIGVSATYAMVFNGRPNDFHYQESTYGQQTGLAIGSVSFPHEVAFEKPIVTFKSVFNYKPLETVLRHETEPAVTSAQLKPETHEECLKHVASGRALDVPCMKAMREMAIYNHVRLHCIWNKPLPHFVHAVAHKLDLALKHAFYSHMTSHKTKATWGLYMEATHIDKLTDRPVFDLAITKPTEEIKFHKVSTGGYQPFSSIASLYDTYVQKLTNNSYPATCALMDQYIRTYDLKTMKLPREDVPSCTYILSTHCTDRKKFAVLVKIDPSVPGTQEIHVYLGKHHVVLVPGSRSEYRVKYDDKDYVIQPFHPFMFNEREEMYAFVYQTVDGSSMVELHANRAGIKLVYNGRNVKVQVHPRYKGELCGMCSEFNGEVEREMRGVGQCLYSDSADFIRSNMVGSCATREPKFPRMCGEEEMSVSHTEFRKTDEETQEPTLKRNVVLNREDKLCFSIKPVPVCEESAIVTETREIEFHCLPKEDRNARKLVVESKRRILGELETKSVDMTESVEVATAC